MITLILSLAPIIETVCVIFSAIYIYKIYIKYI